MKKLEKMSLTGTAFYFIQDNNESFVKWKLLAG